jgi:hypothetical protein
MRGAQLRVDGRALALQALELLVDAPQALPQLLLLLLPQQLLRVVVVVRCHVCLWCVCCVQ